MRLHKATALPVTAFMMLVLFIGACGDSGYGDTSGPTGAPAATAPAASEFTPAAAASPTTVAAPAATAPAASELTPAAGASPTTVAAPATTPSATSAPAQATQLTLVASSVRFEQSSLTAPAGLVTITFDNRDKGVPHNLHVFRGSDGLGAEIGSTEIQAGAARQNLELGNLAVGTYFYQCDVHPSQMMGTLTIS